MGRFLLRHWTALLIILAVGWWAVFYFPNTPSYAVLQLKQAIDARDGQAAARYVDFRKVVQNAGYEMVQHDSSSSGASNIFGELVGKGAVDLLSGPMAALVRSWAIQQVNNGARNVQMPAAAVAGAILALHREGDVATSEWTDHKGQVWQVRMEREDGQWRIVEVKNVRQLLAKLQRQEEKNLPIPVPSAS